MANPEQVEMLRRSVDEWNAWRAEHERERPFLTGANLSWAELSGANLFWAELSSADLSEANLREANLIRANLKGADLKGASLREANLFGADFTGAKLTRADLSGTTLPETHFSETDLDGSCIGGILDGHTEKAWESAGIEWTRIFVGPSNEFEPDHDPEDSSYWLMRSGVETIHAALGRTIEKGLAGADLTVEFTGPLRAERHVIEMVLEEALSHVPFEVRKAPDRFSVTYRHKDDISAGFIAVLAQLAALHVVEPEAVRKVTVRDPETGEETSVQGEELKRGLKDLGEQIRADELNWADDFLIWFAQKTPFGEPLKRRLGEPDVQKWTHYDVNVSAVFGWATEGFLTARKRRAELATTRPKPLALPQATNEDEGSVVDPADSEPQGEE